MQQRPRKGRGSLSNEQADPGIVASVKEERRVRTETETRRVTHANAQDITLGWGRWRGKRKMAGVRGQCAATEGATESKRETEAHN